MGISSSAPWLKYYGDTPHHLDYPSKTIYEMVKAAADQFPKNDAYEFMGKKTTFAQFMQKIDNVARAFLALGIHKGDRVTICMPNCPQAVCSFYALNRIGAVSNMIHPLSAAGEIKFYPDARPILYQVRGHPAGTREPEHDAARREDRGRAAAAPRRRLRADRRAQIPEAPEKRQLSVVERIHAHGQKAQSPAAEGSGQCQ